MQDNGNMGPYVSKPGSRAGSDTGNTYREAEMPNSMARAASTIGVIAVISVFTMLIYPAIVMGATAIILALLSRDREGKMHDKAKNGITTGVVALIADAAILALLCTMLFSNGSFKEQMNEAFKEAYGQTFDDMWDDARDGRLDLDYSINGLTNKQLPDDGVLDYNVDRSTV